jgi:ribosome-associated protein
MADSQLIEDTIARAHAHASEQFLAGTGPGGQNVNKVASTVQLRVNIYALRLPPPVFRRLKEAAGRNLTASGTLLIEARKHRTQDANRSDARERLEAMLRAAFVEPRRRAKTRLNRVGKTQRLKSKKERGAIKAKRGKVSRSDW